jgi:hypothetical protein
MTIQPSKKMSILVNTKHRFHVSQAQRTKKIEHYAILDLGYPLNLNKAKTSPSEMEKVIGLIKF